MTAEIAHIYNYKPLARTALLLALSGDGTPDFSLPKVNAALSQNRNGYPQKRVFLLETNYTGHI
jgi:hypothetical protein